MAGSALSHSVIIADAGPLIALARLHQLTLLRELFGEVLVTTVVRDEIFPGAVYDDQPELLAALSDGWLKVIDVDPGDWKPFNAGVDAGEGSAIFLACELGNALLIMDDRSGRSEARARHLKLIGTAAVVGMAKLKGLIPSAGSVLSELQSVGYRLSDVVIQAVLDDIGE